MFTIACCLVVGLGLGLEFGLDLVSWLVSCYAHVFVLLSTGIVSLLVDQAINQPNQSKS